MVLYEGVPKTHNFCSLFADKGYDLLQKIMGLPDDY